ncbi:hypothetical protein VTK73DRAFT_5949 [Phialemonium thermophilum]|uniref:Uncharacterized protein n=1 Tax=Phialemonium thermophilum TaxID=223376 RepID=A0ABR3V0H3_9PEZI
MDFLREPQVAHHESNTPKEGSLLSDSPPFPVFVAEAPSHSSHTPSLAPSLCLVASPSITPALLEPEAAARLRRCLCSRPTGRPAKHRCLEGVRRILSARPRDL